ncbi:hypothetical protein CKM354_001235300 [Cercospora kikuchii]|uniref:Mid2 domain-containing protein n=1 Tax=Cercospora kikuchii TaxID=84275 RepID=A0A9P3FLU2_9PEZI|nr:uncharacterized protein CKM354_001235300 [Cercospora kikuchii]GIZ49321.1 hypothetical protein CKM354_001235300 [Cercospora kikuchii]
MAFASLFKLSFCLLSTFQLASATPLESSVVVRSPDGRPDAHVIRDISRELRRAAEAGQNLKWEGNTTFDTSWDETVLLQIGEEQGVFESEKVKRSNDSSLETSFGIQVVCRTCYLKGVATAGLSISEDFNVSQAIGVVRAEASETVDNVTAAVEQYFEDLSGEFKNQWQQLVSEGDTDVTDFKIPDWNMTFDVDLESIPDVNLRFQFDELELYMLLDTTLSIGSTYTIPLYKSQSPAGLSITDDLEIGLIFDVELILSAEAAIVIGSGLHLKLNDGFAIDIALFGSDPSNLTFNGGQFEFLPVKVKAAGVVFTAALRVGVHAGFKFETPEFPGSGLPFTNASIPSAECGVEVGIFANIAEFKTNITYVPEDEECAFAAVQSYQLALGAAAGATATINDKSWGPSPNTTKAIYTTELGSTCVISGTPASVSAADVTITSLPTETGDLLGKRQEPVVTSLTHETTYTAIGCRSTGLINCPVSLQSTSLSSTTITKTVTLDADSEIDTDVLSSSIWPGTDARRVAAAVTTVAFGTNAADLPTTTGSPVPYVATATGTADDIRDAINGLPKTTIIGISVGVGVPVILSIVLCCW